MKIIKILGILFLYAQLYLSKNLDIDEEYSLEEEDIDEFM